VAVLDLVDHLVYATPDLDETLAQLERSLGVRATPGGRHPGRGTRNALIAIGRFAYLEVVGPDPEQAEFATPRWFEIDELAAPRLVTWAAKSDDLETLVAGARAAGAVLGPLASGTRTRADGTTLRWRFTDPTTVVASGVVPFFIDWGVGAHPADTAVAGPTLTGLRAEHPEPERVAGSLAALGLDLHVTYAPCAGLIATLRTAAGIVELR
jgi:hypothetical protein